MANRGGGVIEIARPRGFSATGRARFKSLGEAAIRQGTDPDLIAHLEEFLDRADELSLQRIRPYALADRWGGLESTHRP
jgi:hypothetical protein